MAGAKSSDDNGTILSAGLNSVMTGGASFCSSKIELYTSIYTSGAATGCYDSTITVSVAVVSGSTAAATVSVVSLI